MGLFSNHIDIKHAELMRNEQGDDLLVMHLKIPGKLALNSDAPEAVAKSMPEFMTNAEEVAAGLPWVKADPDSASIIVGRIDDFLVSQGLKSPRDEKNKLKIIMPSRDDANISYELKLSIYVKDSPQKVIDLAGALAENGKLTQHVSLAEVQKNNGNSVLDASASDLTRFLIGMNAAAIPPEMRGNSIG